MYRKFLIVAFLILAGLISFKLYYSLTAFSQLQADPYGTSAGSTNPTLIITEVMDYRCVHCQNMHDVVETFLALHPEARVVYRYYPIMGQQSIYEAKMAIAAARQGKFAEMHQLLITRKEHVRPDELEGIVRDLGLDAARFHDDLVSWKITMSIVNTIIAAQAKKIRSTPTFIVNGKAYTNAPTMGTIEGFEETIKESLDKKDNKS